MKNIILLLLVLSYFQTYSQDSTTFPLGSMITIINNSLEEADKRMNDANLNIESAEVSLETVYDKSGGGGFKIFVKASKKWELEKSSNLTFEFKSSKDNEQKSVDFFKKPVFEETLTTAIVNAAKQWKNTSSTINGLTKSSFSVEISFVVKKITSVGIEFEVWGVGIDGGGDFENSAIHTVTLKFKS